MNPFRAIRAVTLSGSFLGCLSVLTGAVMLTRLAQSGSDSSSVLRPFGQAFLFSGLLQVACWSVTFVALRKLAAKAKA